MKKMDEGSLVRRLLYYCNPIDGRYEDLFKGKIALNVFRDFTAGLVVAMVAIPLAMGFAMASGLRPEQGIVGGAVAGLVGALFGGSKYQVYGPTAAFIPIIAGIMAQHGYPFLVIASILAGTVLAIMGITRLGRFVAAVPQSVVVGFTIGIAVVIGMSQVGEVLGLAQPLGYAFTDKIRGIASQYQGINGYAVALALGTVVITKMLLKVSKFLPAPLLSIAVGTFLASTIWAGKGITVVSDKYGKIPTDFWNLSLPSAIPLNSETLFSLLYYTAAIVFVAAVESLLCSRMADRLAENKGMPYNPNKELWGQGLVNIVVVLLNGFPHTGALARTAVNIKLGAVSPLAGIFKCFLKLGLAAYLATYLEMVPMACIGGILLYVAMNMVKPMEIKLITHEGRVAVGVMAYTAIAVVLTDFLTGVASALVVHVVVTQVMKYRKLQPAPAVAESVENRRTGS